MRFTSVLPMGVLLAGLALLSVPAMAADAAGGQGPLSLTVDKAQVLHLSTPAQRVIVANPAIADVTVEKPTLITLFGKAAGETSLLVLGADDQEIINRSIVVTGAGDHSVTVHTPGGQGPVSREYSCIDQRCSKVGGSDGSSGAASPSPTPSPSTSTPPR